MSNAVKSIKSAAKEAKMRLKSRFWEEYRKEVDTSVRLAEEEGLAPSGVKNYFKSKVERTVKGAGEEEEKFYIKVRDMLDEEGGRPSDALDRLMDKPYFSGLDYLERERYLFKLAEKYLSAMDRYDRERKIEKRFGKQF